MEFPRMTTVDFMRARAELKEEVIQRAMELQEEVGLEENGRMSSVDLLPVLRERVVEGMAAALIIEATAAEHRPGGPVEQACQKVKASGKELVVQLDHIITHLQGDGEGSNG